MRTFDERWEEIHKAMEWGKYPEASVVRFVARNYYNMERNQVKILDFGCGAGANTWFLAREGFDVYAFDGSESAVRRASEYLKKEGLSNVEFRVRDGGSLDYAKNFFDCIIDNVCIYANKLDNILYMYKTVYSLLKTGGRFYSSAFGTETSGYGTGTEIEEGTYENISEGVLSGRAIAHFFTKDEFETIIMESGFKNVRIENMTYTDQGANVQMFIATGMR